MSLWPWRRGIADAEARLAEAERQTKNTPALIEYSRDVNNELLGVVARNGFGEAIQLTMRRRMS